MSGSMATRSDLTRELSRDAALGVRLVAEAVGTFALTFVAAGADTMGIISGGQVGPAARAVAPGLLVMAFIYALGDTSGAHFNPAVTLGFTLRRLFPAAWMFAYWAAQLVGAVAAALVLRLLFGEALGAGVSTPHVAPLVALALEGALSWILVTVILGTADRARLIGSDAAIAVGATIALCGLIANPVEGASMNPARSIGPALVTLRLTDVWIYVLGPALGAVAAVGLTAYLHGASPRDSKQVEMATGKGSRSRG
jgi:aquaporin Z